MQVPESGVPDYVTGNPWCLRWMPTMEIPGIPLPLKICVCPLKQEATHTHTQSRGPALGKVSVEKRDVDGPGSRAPK